MAEQAKPIDEGLAKAREASGIMDGSKDPSLDIASEEEGGEVAEPGEGAKPEPEKPEEKPKPEEEPEEDGDGEEPDPDKDGDDDGEGEGGDGSKPKPPAEKPTKIEKALFKQVGELRTAIDALATAVAKGGSPAKAEAAAEAVDEEIASLMKKAEEKGADPEFVKELASTLTANIKKSLDKEGLLRKDLPAETQEKLKLLDEIQKERAEGAQAQSFSNEWTTLVPNLQKQYPNAGASELAAAQKLMDEIAHSDKGGVVIDKKNAIIKGYPLEYILFQNRKAFDAILKVAKGNKSGEGESHDIGKDDEGESQDIDLDPEKMTPEKYKALQKQKLKDADEEEPIQFIG